MSDRPSDDGTALVELIGLAVMLLIPLTYLAVSVFAAQRAVFSAGAAAREAGRAFVLADSTSSGLDRADAAMRLALAGQQSGDGALSFHAGGSGCGSATVPPQLDPGESYDVCVRVEIALPFAGRGLLATALHSPSVTGRMTVHVDDYRRQR